MSTRPQAVPTTQIDNDRVIVTEWRFAPGAETGEQEGDVIVLVTAHQRHLLTGAGGHRHAV